MHAPLEKVRFLVCCLFLFEFGALLAKHRFLVFFLFVFGSEKS